MPTDTSVESSAERSLATSALSALDSDAALARRTSLAGSVGSIVVHGAIVALVYASGQTPDYGFEFTVPAELELGMTEAVEVEATPPPAPPAPPEPEPLRGMGAGEGTMDAGVPERDGSIGDGGVPSDAPRRRRRDAALDPDAGPLLASGEGDHSPVAFLPAGGQIALRLDLDHVRASPVRADVERLLAAIPDWQALLGTSGVEPVRDLSRVLVATPNLQRSSLVVAGRLSDDAPAPDVIVEQLIAAGGGSAQWQEQDGVPTADWPNPDATPRRVAIIGDRHFVIARGEDLPRVLAIAASRAEERPNEPPRTSPADALLALPDGAAITLEIEGARAYVRQSPCRVPTRLAARADEVDGMVHVSLHAVFDSEDESAEAASCFETLRARALSNPIVSFMGFGGPLGDLEIDTEGASLDATTRLSYSHVRTALRYAQGMFRRSAPPPASTGVTPVPPPGVTPVPPPPGITPVPPPPVPPPSSTPVPPPSSVTPVPPPPGR